MSATITWCGHATVRLSLPDGRVVFIDPWLQENPACPDDLKKPDRCDLILLTHGHFDHTGDAPALIQAFDPLVVGTVELCVVLKKQIGKGRFAPMNTGGTQNEDGVRVTLTQAFHSSSVDSPGGPLYAGMPNGLVVRVDGLASLYHAGDTDVFGDMKLIARLFEPKVCFLPIGDHFTMGAKGAALAAELLEPKVIVPIHYKSFPLLAQSTDEFQKALPDALKKRLLVPKAGQTMSWTAEGVTL